MPNDPYTPPQSAASDVAPDRMLAERPRQVARAVFVLWVSYALAIPLMFLEAGRAPEGASFGMLAVWAVVLAIGAALNVSIWRGANWARIVYLIFFIVSFLSLWSTASEMLVKSVLEFLLNLVNMFLDAAALYMIFTKPGSLWFRKAAP